MNWIKVSDRLPRFGQRVIIYTHENSTHDWVRDNVIAHLWGKQPDRRKANEWSRDGGRGGLLSRQEMRGEISRFCDPEAFGTPEFWGYFSDYDWVVLCQLFGTMMDLPEGWPMFCMDVKQLAVMRGNPKLPEQSDTEHHALNDARWTKKAWESFVPATNASATKA